MMWIGEGSSGGEFRIGEFDGRDEVGEESSIGVVGEVGEREVPMLSASVGKFSLSMGMLGESS